MIVTRPSEASLAEGGRAEGGQATNGMAADGAILGGGPPPANRWIPALSGYRALAALSVFVFHLVSVDPPDGLAGRVTVPLGNAAVCLFFVLSGFLIYRPFARWAFGIGPRVPAGQFIIRRCARIMPLYWAILTIHLFVFHPDETRTLGEIATAYGLVQNFRGILVFLPPFVAWSLCIELWFSVALPFLAGPIRELGKNRAPRSVLLIQFAGFALMVVAAVLFREWAIEAPTSGRILWVPAYLDWFAGGLALATWITYREQIIGDKPPIAIPSAALGALIAATAYWAVTQLNLPNGFETPTRFQTHAQFLLEPVMAVALVAIAVWPGVSLGRIGRFLSSRFFGWLGAVSYGVYLAHPLVIDEIVETFPDTTRLIVGPIGLVITLVVAHLLYRLVENPSSRFVDSLVRRFASTNSSPNQSAATQRTNASSVLAASPALEVGSSSHSLPALESGSIERDSIEGTVGESTALEPVALENTALEQTSLEPANRERSSFEHTVGAADPQELGRVRRFIARVRRVTRPAPWWAPVGATLAALVVPFLHFREKYVADARYELFADPTSRLSRIFVAWDPTRDLGRPAEEVWPGVTLFTSGLSVFGFEPWVIERVWHGALLALALLGARKLALELAPDRGYSAVVVGLLYAFGPFSAVYLIPSTLYINHMVAPWLAVAVVRASRRHSPIAWAAVVAMMVFLVGNADPPGLVFAAVPAITCMIGLLLLRPASRKPLLQFGVASLLLTAVTSATMITKTVAGADALGRRLLETEPVVAVAANSSFGESIRGMGFWLLYVRLEPSIDRVHQIPLVENAQMMLFSLVPVVAGLVLLASRLRQLSPAATGNYSKSNLTGRPHLGSLGMAAIWLVIGTLIMVGPFPTTSPSRWGGFLLSLYDQSELAFGFRSSHKAGVISALGVALLGGWALGEIARRRQEKNSNGEIAWFSVAFVVVLIAGITQPFWRTSLYNPNLTSDALPGYWTDVGDWFEANPPQGRVLVLPGSTNNGYRWGSVGDDLLDPIIPNRLVASTLPLSTPIGADVTDALDRHLTSADYQPGDFRSLAQRFGISHVVIRNDLDWQTQGLAAPSDLDRLRTDPELLPVGTFGPYDAVEVYSVLGSEERAATLLPVTSNPRQILVEGDGDAAMRLSSTGILRGNHPVRYASTISTNDLPRTTGDTALVVLADTKMARDRRITYFGYNYALPAAVDDPEERARIWSQESITAVEIPDAEVTSSVDRWAAGTAFPPTAAVDANRDTMWVIPPLADPLGTSWIAESGSLKRVENLTVDLFDPARRVQELEIKINGKVHEHTLKDGIATARVGFQIQRLEIKFTELGPGTSTIGIREVAFGNATPTAILTLPTRIVNIAARNPVVATNLEEAELIVSIGHAGFSNEPIHRKFKLWRDDQFSIEARVQTTVTEPYCSSDLVLINGVQIPMKVEPDLNGFGRLGFCDEKQELRLSRGSYVISITPDFNTNFAEVRLTTMDELLTPLATLPVDLTDPNLRLSQGDLVISPAAFDRGWRLGDPDAAQSMALDGLAGFQVTEPDLIGPIYHKAEGPLKVSLWITGLGILTCLVIFAGSALRRRQMIPVASHQSAPNTAATSTATHAANESVNQHAINKPAVGTEEVRLPKLEPPTQRDRPRIIAMVVAWALAWLAFGWMAAIGVALVAVVATIFGARRLWLIMVAAATALVVSLILNIFDVTDIDAVPRVVVAVVGAVIAASVHRWPRPKPPVIAEELADLRRPVPIGRNGSTPTTNRQEPLAPEPAETKASIPKPTVTVRLSADDVYYAVPREELPGDGN